MQEYEFIINAIEEDLCDQLVSVICRENYDDKKYPDGFRRIFDEYGKLHEAYISKSDSNLLQSYQQIWKEKQKNRLDTFIKDLKAENNDFDIDALAKKYMEELEKEDIKTTDKRVCIYPYLTEEMQKNNSFERRNKNGKEI